jgi:hypothetical protein
MRARPKCSCILPNNQKLHPPACPALEQATNHTVGARSPSLVATSISSVVDFHRVQEQLFTAHMISWLSMIRPSYYMKTHTSPELKESNPTHCDATIDPDPMSLVAYDASSDEEDAGEPPAAAAPSPPPSASSVGPQPRHPKHTPPPPAPSQ